MSDQEDPTFTDEHLSAYVDGEVDPALRTEIEAYLAGDPAAAAKVRAYQAQIDNIHGEFDAVLEDPIPETLLMAARARPWWRGWALPASAVAGIVMLAVGGAGGWYARGLSLAEEDRVGQFTRHAASAHRIFTAERRFAVEVAATDQKRMVRWLSKRLGHQLRVPSLSKYGFELVGARQLATPENLPAAQFMYQDKKLRRVTLYVRPTSYGERTSFRFAEAGQVLMFYWIDKPFSYALAGPLKKNELLKVSRAVSEQISP